MPRISLTGVTIRAQRTVVQHDDVQGENYRKEIKRAQHYTMINECYNLKHWIVYKIYNKFALSYVKLLLSYLITCIVQLLNPTLAPR